MRPTKAVWMLYICAVFLTNFGCKFVTKNSGSREIGEKVNSALYLVIQHAEKDDRTFFLPIMRRAVQNNSANKQDLAHLEDRVALNQGRKQIYGTQLGLDEKTKEYYLFPLENPETVDVRRSKMGMIPIREYLIKWQIGYP